MGFAHTHTLNSKSLVFAVHGVCMVEKHNDGDWLREKYENEFMTAGEIAELTDVSERTIRRRLKDHGVEVRTNGPTKKPLSKEKLQREYVEQGQSARQIANGEDYSRNHVQQSLEYHDIEIRSRQQAIWKHHGEVCSYRTHRRGHVVVGSGDDSVYVHQLIAIANGADPHDIFSGGSVQCHHKTHIPWDNRPDAIEVLDESNHHKRHWPDMETDTDGTIIEKSLR